MLTCRRVAIALGSYLALAAGFLPMTSVRQAAAASTVTYTYSVATRGTVSWGPGRLDVLVQGPDAGLWHTSAG